MAIESLKNLKADPKNRRAHNPRNMEMLRAALEAVGAARSIVIDETGEILAGNGVVQAATAMGLDRVQVVDVEGDTLVAVRRSGLTADQKRALAIYDNRTAELAEWDFEQLAADQAAGLSLQPFWSPDEQAVLLPVAKDGLTDPDLVPAPRPTSVLGGDLFALGAHRVLCGDSTSPGAVGRLLGDTCLDLVVTSPPYNVDLASKATAPVDWMHSTDRAPYLALIEGVARAFMPHVAVGRFVAWNVGVNPRTYPHRQVVILEDCGLQFNRQLVWQKSGVAYPIFQSTVNTARARHYKPNYTYEVIELLTVGAEPNLGTAIHPNLKYANDVWQIHQAQATIGLKTIGDKSGTLKQRGKASHRIKEHPAPFPVEVPRALASFLTGLGETVYDPFGGSGSTLLACEQLERRGYLMEIDPTYCQIIIDRWEAFTGQHAVKVGEHVGA